MKRTNKNDHGIVLVEFALAFSLLLIIILGFAQLYMVSLDKVDHFALATQVLMGPQEKSVSYDSATGIFSALDGSTSPTSDEFYDTVGNFFLSRVPSDKFALYLLSGYLLIDPATGFVLDLEMDAVPKSYAGVNSTGCTNVVGPSHRTGRFAANRLDLMKVWAQSQQPTPADPENDDGRVGVKIYDFKLGSTRYRQYQDVMPSLFMVICTKPVNISFTTNVYTYQMVVPRRNLN